MVIHFESASIYFFPTLDKNDFYVILLKTFKKFYLVGPDYGGSQDKATTIAVQKVLINRKKGSSGFLFK